METVRLVKCHICTIGESEIDVAEIDVYKLFEHKCVLEVCVHIHPIIIKIHPVDFFKIPFLKSGCSEIPVRMT